MRIDASAGPIMAVDGAARRVILRPAGGYNGDIGM
jgi:hypothetical protein